MTKINISEKSFFIGDVHGNIKALKLMLDDSSNDETLFFLGDLINRGGDSRAVLDLLLSRPNTYFIYGNHEMAFLSLVDYISKNKLEKSDLEEDDAVLFLIQLMSIYWILDLEMDEIFKYANLIRDRFYHYIECEYKGLKIGLVHAAVPNYDWLCVPKYVEQSIWSFDNFNDKEIRPVENIDLVIHGHVPVKRITKKSNVFYIDTLSYKSESAKLTKISINKIIGFLKR